MKTILLVDDEPHVLRIMKMGLVRAGYNVLTAPNGEQGLAQFRERQPDAMVADIDMPIMNGVEMCSRIVAEFPETTSCIFISTSRAELELRDWIAELGKIELLEKPISMRTLTARLSKQLDA